MKFKKILLICLIIIIILSLGYSVFYLVMKNGFSSINTVTLWDSGGFGNGHSYYISIDQTGKVTLESISKEEIKKMYENYMNDHPNSSDSFDNYYNSFTTKNPYYYKVEYQIDKSLVNDLNKTIKENFLVFFQSAKPNDRILDGVSYRIYVKLNNGREFSNGGYQPQNKKFNIIQNKIFDCVTADDNAEKISSYEYELELRYRY